MPRNLEVSLQRNAANNLYRGIWRLFQIQNLQLDLRQKAVLNMFVYTLSTAGTLTKGDLPVYLVSAAQELAKV